MSYFRNPYNDTSFNNYMQSACTTKSKDTVFNQTKFIEQQSLSYKFLRESYFVIHVQRQKQDLLE